MPQKTVDLDSPVTSDSEASEPVKGIKRTNSSVDDKKDKGPKKLKGNEIETVEGLAFWKKNKDSGVVPFHRLETGKWFQVPKGNIPKAQKNPPARLEYQMLFDAPEARKKDGGNLSRDEINDYIMRSRDMWPIWKRWDQLSSLGLLQHCNYSIKEAIKMLKDTGDQSFTESKEFDTICGHATMPYRNKWGESDVRIPPETKDYRTTDAPNAPWPEATRFQLARDRFGVQTRKDRKNLDDTKQALKRQATGA